MRKKFGILLIKKWTILRQIRNFGRHGVLIIIGTMWLWDS